MIHAFHWFRGSAPAVQEHRLFIPVTPGLSAISTDDSRQRADDWRMYLGRKGESGFENDRVEPDSGRRPEPVFKEWAVGPE